MSQKECEKCHEIVDGAKAFCPACGHAFVEEQTRREESGFDKMDSTVQFGQTMYNMMLSDMGLNISKAPDVSEKRIEVLLPAAAPAPAKPPEVRQDKPKGQSNAKWYILGAVIAVLFFFFVLATAAAVFIYWSRFR